MKHEDLRFFNPWGEIDVSQNRLPHWQQSGAVFFVTWRLADSIPKAKLDRHYEEREVWKNQHPEPWDLETEAKYHELFSAQMDQWMDAGHGSCLLRERANAAIVKDVLLHFEGERSAMVSFVVMPNHVHGMFALHHDWRLEQMIHSWKRYSAIRINRLENRSGTLWQKDYFDRLLRDRKHFENCVRYIRQNPSKARLKEGEYLLWENDIAREIA